MDFPTWYQSRHKGRDPFPWQSTVAAAIAAGNWPTALTAPTGCGKTSILAVWLWALEESLPVPRRLVYVVDRQLIVDSVSDEARGLAGESPLRPSVVQMRGGLTIEDDWLDPVVPAIIVSTVDQAGSRLLFSGYGVSSKATPIHAALLGNDALWVIDEVHLAQPLLRTLSSVQRIRMQAREPLSLPFHVIVMSATWTAPGALGLTEDDLEHAALQPRLTNPKPLTLRDIEPDANLPAALAAEARALRDGGSAVVAVVVNTVASARKVFERLRKHGDAVLLTGLIRKPDRERLLETYMPRMATNTRDGGREPLYVVATQTIEVGADLDFDAMVSESAPLSALMQRAGRLNRLGELPSAPFVIVHQAESDKEKLKLAKAKKDGRERHHLRYRRLALDTRKWFKKHKVRDFGVQAITDLARSNALDEGVAESPDLLVGHLDLLSKTSVDHRIPVDPWLRGYPEPEWKVFVCWRADASPMTVRAAPPVRQELLELPVYALSKLPHCQPIRWDGEDAVRVDEHDVRRLPPGATLVLDSGDGGCDAFGWNPDCRDPVSDYGDTETRMRILGPADSDWHALARERGMANPGRILPYPGGALVLAASQWTSETAIKPVTLGRHQRAVRARAHHFAQAVGLPDNLARAVSKAAAGHDHGKRDPRWQGRLGNHQGPPLAKGPFEPEAWESLPRGWRHEMRSALVSRDPLVRHLIGAHHGHGRPRFPAAPDPDLWRDLAGWAAQFETLQETYGYWGLAYLEALVRIADWQISDEEQHDDQADTPSDGLAA